MISLTGNPAWSAPMTMRGLEGDSLMSSNARIVAEEEANRKRWLRYASALAIYESSVKFARVVRRSGILAAIPSSWHVKRDRCTGGQANPKGGAKQCPHVR